MQKKLLILLFFVLLPATTMAKTPYICPLATTTDLVNLSKKLSEEASTTSDFREMGRLAIEGIEIANECLKKDQKEVGCYYYRAINRGIELKTRATSIGKELSKMVSDFQKVIELNPRYADGGAFLAMGYIYLKAPSLADSGISRDLDEASKYAQKAIKVSSKNPYHLTLAGEIAFKQKDYKKAIAFFEKAQKALTLIKKQNEEDKELKKDLKKLIKKTKKKIT